MHKSRLGGIIIDCQTDDLEGAAAFWSQALGCAASRHEDPAEKNYIQLRTAPNDPHVEIQRVEHPSRVHIDIETDDIDAEVERLEKLGARRIDRIRSWVVMEAPTGQRFCVVQPQRAAFEVEAHPWLD